MICVDSGVAVDVAVDVAAASAAAGEVLMMSADALFCSEIADSAGGWGTGCASCVSMSMASGSGSSPLIVSPATVVVASGAALSRLGADVD